MDSFMDEQKAQKLSDRQFLEETVALFTPVEQRVKDIEAVLFKTDKTARK